MPQVDIAVPAYNCAPWIDAFFESVLAQDYSAWRIIARDDASTDGTPARLVWWQSRLGERMTILPDSGTRNLGMVGNYNAVIAAATESWVMLADPDDVWKPGKLSLTVRAMSDAEASAGAHTPVLVCTDAQVVDQGLVPVASSYWQWVHCGPHQTDRLPRLAVESPVLAPMVNRALLQLALPLIGAAACADWWLGMVACTFGQVVSIPATTFLYRRHPANDSLDPFGSTIGNAVRRTLADLGEPRRRVNRLLRQFAPQAGAFAARFRERLPLRDLGALEAAARLPSLGALARRWAVVRHDLWFSSPLKNVGLMLLL